MARVLQRIAYGAAVIMVVVVLTALLTHGRSEEESGFVTLGTGSVSGIYYPLGGAIAKLVNRKHEQYGFRVVVEATDGSIQNLNGVLDGTYELGIVQADIEYRALHGEGEWFIQGPCDDLRAVCSLHREMVTLLATEVSGVSALKDLKGKRVSIGSPGSGQHANALDILSAAGLDPEADIVPIEVRAEEGVGLLRRGEIDALFYTVGHPNELVEDATSGQPVRFVSIPGAVFGDDRPYFVPATIPIHLYPLARNTTDVDTIGLSATLLTSQSVDERYIYAITMNLFENLDEFRSLHPAFASVTAASMVTGFSAQIHPGALRYYRQSGALERGGE
jgi:TRAP transporter TAXI family solute receptor